MAERATVARPYAKAAFAHARDKNVLDAWSGWLGIARAVVSSDDYKSFESSPGTSRNQLRDLVANGSAQGRVGRLKRVEDRSLGHIALDVNQHLATDAREDLQVTWEHHADLHDSVCTSTETTAGRSRTIGAQLSPASDEAYTWPPVVPK